MSLKSLILTGNYINSNFGFYRMSNELDTFDNEQFLKNNKDFYAVATNVKTGKPEYLKITNPLNELEILRATSAIPFLSRLVKIDNNKYLDGGISDSIPIEFHKEQFAKTIVILTQPLDYIKKPLKKKEEIAFKIKYFKYKELINTTLNRYKNYNDTIKKIKELESKKELFVIRPSKSVSIKLSENDQNKLEEIYQEGIKEGKKAIKDLKEYLK